MEKEKGKREKKTFEKEGETTIITTRKENIKRNHKNERNNKDHNNNPKAEFHQVSR
jgi:hypothetical protein